MVNQTSLTLAPGRPQGWLASPGRRLACFLLALALICAIACLYFYQVSKISAIRGETVQLQEGATRLEHENAAMMIDLAQLDAPEHIQSAALERGMAPLAQASYITEPVAKAPVAPQEARPKASAWQAMVGELRALFAGDTAQDLAKAGT